MEMRISRQQSLRRGLFVSFAVLVLIGSHLYVALPQCNITPRLCYNYIAGLNAPYRYRILSYILEGAPTYDSAASALLLTSFIIHSVCVLLSCFGLYLWLKRHILHERAIIGVFLLAAGWLLAFYYYNRDISIALELTFTVWFLVLIEGRLLPLIAIIALASLNRETGFMLALVYAAYHGAHWLNGGLLLATWAAVMIALRLSLGSADHVLGLDGTLAYNLENIRHGVLINIILSPLWGLTLIGYRSAPAPLRRLVWVAMVGLAAVLVGGAWQEAPRLTLVVYPLILPVILGGEKQK